MLAYIKFPRNSRFFRKVTLGILEFHKLEFPLELDISFQGILEFSLKLDIKTTFKCDFKDFVDKRIKI